MPIQVWIILGVLSLALLFLTATFLVLSLSDAWLSILVAPAVLLVLVSFLLLTWQGTRQR